MRELSAIEARVLGTLMEKARTVPDSYPLSLNSLLSGCNQKTSREPLMEIDEAKAQEALAGLRGLSLVFEATGARVPRYEHNTQRALAVDEAQAVLLGLLMLRGAQPQPSCASTPIVGINLSMAPRWKPCCRR